MKKLIIMFATLVAVMSGAFSNGIINSENNWYQAKLNYEKGFLKVLSNTIQFGTTANGNSQFDYVASGGQEIFLPFERFTAELNLFNNHDFVFLYQPLTANSIQKLEKDVKIDDVQFLKGEAVEVNYGFSFWRFSYLYNIIKNKNYDFGLGLSLQFRNADIYFATLDGKKITKNDNLGPVPILKMKGNVRFDNGMFIGSETDGFYASSAFFNGAAYNFEGSILDSSIYTGLKMTDYLSTYLNLRLLLGGGKGEGKDLNGIVKYTDNFITLMTVSIGFIIE